MSDLKSELDLLENLSKKMSDLLFNNKFAEISAIDRQRREIILKIKNNETKKNGIKTKIKNLIKDNNELVKITENKMLKLSKNRNKYTNRLKAYSLVKN